MAERKWATVATEGVSFSDYFFVNSLMGLSIVQPSLSLIKEDATRVFAVMFELSKSPLICAWLMLVPIKIKIAKREDMVFISWSFRVLKNCFVTLIQW